MKCFRTRTSHREREKHAPHSADSFGGFCGTTRSVRSFFSNMLRISISSHSGDISLLFFSAIGLLLDVRFASDYSTLVPRVRNQYQSRGGYRRKVSLPKPLRACSPPRNPHLDQCRHVKTIRDRTMFETVPIALDFCDYILEILNVLK